MIQDSADEPPIDTTLTHYMEGRALEIALEKARTPAQRASVESLIALRGSLMQRRDFFAREAIARRHARGEIYSKARVAAINAMGPSKGELENTVHSLYLSQPDADEVLKAHARSHFGFGLVSARLMLADMPPELAEAARAMQGHEESFASAWVGAIDDAAFQSELRESQRDAPRVLRTSTRPMYLVTCPVSVAFDDEQAHILGKAWSSLDKLALELGVEALSSFIALPGQEDYSEAQAGRVLATVDALIAALQSPGRKFPSKRAVGAVLDHMRATLVRLGDGGATAYFDIDT